MHQFLYQLVVAFRDRSTENCSRLFVITYRVHSTTGRLCFDTCLSVCPQEEYPSQVQPGGYPHASLDSGGGCTAITGGGLPPSSLGRVGVPPSLDGGVSPFSLGGGYPHHWTGGLPWSVMGVPPIPRLDGGTYPPWQGWGNPRIQDNRWSTWYAAVGMPLAFKQEDCLVNLY